MIKISRLADYSVVVLATLAKGNAQMTASGISEKTRIPEPTVAKVLKLLGKDSIVSSLRGVNGGYRLSKPAEEISIADIIMAVDGPISHTTCVEGSANTCGYACHCPVRGRWDGVNMAIRDALEGVTLKEMINTPPVLPAAKEQAHGRN